MTCTDGKWNKQVTCEPVDCGVPDQYHVYPATFNCSEGTTFGKKCSFTCRPPALLKGIGQCLCSDLGIAAQLTQTVPGNICYYCCCFRIIHDILSMKNYETLWEGLFILEVKFLCISLSPSFDLSLITAGQAVMTVNIASIQPKHGKVMGINQIELSHLLSHVFSVFCVCLPSMPPPCIWKGRRLKSPMSQWHSPPSLFFLIHPSPLSFSTLILLYLWPFSPPRLGLSTLFFS